MADERHAPDTLFFVAEEDFRLFSRHSTCQPEVLARVSEAAYAASSTSYAARHPSGGEDSSEPVALPLDELYAWRYQREPIGEEGTSDLFGPPAAGTESWRKLVGGLYQSAEKPKSSDIQAHGILEFLMDLVKMVTAAARKGKVDLVWLSYDARTSKGRKCKVVHAATLIAVSAEGAKKLADIVPDRSLFGADAHFDVLLIRYLEKYGNQFGASYVYPSVGHYQAHLSQSSDHEGWRPARWEQNWIQEGTRVAHAEAGRTRWICGFCDKGVDWIRDIHIPERGGEDLRWFTRTSAPPHWAEEEEARRALAREEAKGKGRKPRTVIQPVYTAGATDMQGNPEMVTKRRRRSKRANDVGYAHRIFAAEGEEVVSVCMKKGLSLSPTTNKKISSIYVLVHILP